MPQPKTDGSRQRAISLAFFESLHQLSTTCQVFKGLPRIIVIHVCINVSIHYVKMCGDIMMMSLPPKTVFFG